MKRLLIIIGLLVPFFAHSQYNRVQFNCADVPMGIDPQHYSQSIDTLLGLDSNFTFVMDSIRCVYDTPANEQHLSFQQFYMGKRVEFANIVLHYKASALVYINGEYIRTIGNSTIVVTSASAFDSARYTVPATEYLWDNPSAMTWVHSVSDGRDSLLYPAPHPCMVYLANDSSGIAVLAYKFEIYATNPLQHQYIYIDAGTGNVIGIKDLLLKALGSADTKYSGSRPITTTATLPPGVQYQLADYSRGNGIETYNMLHSRNNFGAAPLFTDNDNNWTSAEYHNANKDDAALDAQWGAEMTYDYFKNTFNRNGLDGAGKTIKQFVHYDVAYDNADWDHTTEVMIYGDGDGVNNDELTDLDVVAHEISHGINHYTANLGGANGGLRPQKDDCDGLNEGLSDIWGACVKHYAAPEKNMWLHADQDRISTPYYERSFIDPSSATPAQASRYGGTHWNDLGGDSHIKSGALMFWFYLLVNGGSGTNDMNPYSVFGIGLDKAAMLVYEAETNGFLKEASDFPAMRSATVQLARTYYHDCSEELIDVISAWAAVTVGDPFPAAYYNYITWPELDHAMSNYLVQNILMTGSHIAATAKVKYEAVNAVYLIDGFKTEPGAYVVAQTVPCTTVVTARKTDPNQSVAGGLTSNPSNADGHIKLYPNPTQGAFNVWIENGHGTISVLDMSGRLVQSVESNQVLTEFDISNLSAGIYMVRVIVDGNNYFYKIVKN
jgi:Zn-dependent metalloprotease